MQLSEQQQTFSDIPAHRYAVGDLVLRFNQSWGRGKDEDVYSGPYVVKRLLGNTSLVIGDYDRPDENKTVFSGHLKPFYLPETDSWELNSEILDEVLAEWKLDKQHFRIIHEVSEIKKARKVVVIAVHMDLDKFFKAFKQKKLRNMILVVPHLPCMDWWKEAITVKGSWVELQNVPDTFVQNGKPVGNLCFKSWVVKFKA